jgi:hypothetical protein
VLTYASLAYASLASSPSISPFLSLASFYLTFFADAKQARDRKGEIEGEEASNCALRRDRCLLI